MTGKIINVGAWLVFAKTGINRVLLTGASSVLFLSACGSDGGVSTQVTPETGEANTSKLVNMPSDTVDHHGLVIFSHTDGSNLVEAGITDGILSAYADFKVYDSALSSRYIDNRFSNGTLNTCAIKLDGVSEVDETDNSVDNDLDIGFEFVSAGDVLSVMSPNGSWTELVLNVDDSALVYTQPEDGTFLGMVPVGAQLNIPGEVFPFFTGVDVPHSPKIENVSLSNTEQGLFTSDTDLTWDPAATSAEDIQVVVLFSLEGLIVNVADSSNTQVSISCVLDDVGSFSFPENIKALMSDNEVAISERLLSRLFSKTVVKDNTAVSVVNGASIIF